MTKTKQWIVENSVRDFSIKVVKLQAEGKEESITTIVTDLRTSPPRELKFNEEQVRTLSLMLAESQEEFTK